MEQKPQIRKAPLPCFDTLNTIHDWAMPAELNRQQAEDFAITVRFLSHYVGSVGTFNTYRRETERLLQWCWHIVFKDVGELGREDIEEFVRFCQKPPKAWIGLKKPPRFLDVDGERVPNPEWRPFVATVSKAAFRQGKTPDKSGYVLSDGAVKELLAILSSYFTYLLQEEYIFRNPVALIRQKSKFIQTRQGPARIRRLSQHQWQTVIETAELMASENENHERTLFMMSVLYSLYLRISELAASDRWTPTMNDFYRDQEECWWFTTVGKGNKQRDIAVSDATLNALKRWRSFLGLPALPSPGDSSPLFPKTRGTGPITSSTYIREIVQTCFDRAIEELQTQGEPEEARALMEATVHWLRHTGISDDVKRRPREHVRDDAGHSSGAITDKYIDVELRERHQSAQRKTMKPV